MSAKVVRTSVQLVHLWDVAAQAQANPTAVSRPLATAPPRSVMTAARRALREAVHERAAQRRESDQIEDLRSEVERLCVLCKVEDLRSEVERLRVLCRVWHGSASTYERKTHALLREHEGYDGPGPSIQLADALGGYTEALGEAVHGLKKRLV